MKFSTIMIFLVILTGIISAFAYFGTHDTLTPEEKNNLFNNASGITSPINITNTTVNITTNTTINISDDIRIANWNLQIFGTSKASNETLLNTYADIINDYDIIFVQEIRDSSATAFPALCSKLPEYNCINSSRAGRSSSKEQYGLIYKNNLELVSTFDTNAYDVYQIQFERPPYFATFKLDDKNITFANIHTKPEDVPNEMEFLENFFYEINDTKVVILGDLNADCDYYTGQTTGPFNGWYWPIDDPMDTTVKSTDCAYDRFIMNFPYEDFGIYTNITEDMSDHYLVWVEI